MCEWNIGKARFKRVGPNRIDINIDIADILYEIREHNWLRITACLMPYRFDSDISINGDRTHMLILLYLHEREDILHALEFEFGSSHAVAATSENREEARI